MNKLKLGKLDHYTLIVEDAKASSDFMVNTLGFKFIREQHLNTGTAPEGAVDMLNYVLKTPDEKQFCVITEGVTEDSVFQKLLRKSGPGIHHVAFETNDIDAAFNQLSEQNIELTADTISTDMLTGLKQFFISNKYTGHFIEIIERIDQPDDSEFTNENMKDLALSMKKYAE